LEIKQAFWGLYEQAKKGKLNHLKSTPEGLLTLILLFDQKLLPFMRSFFGVVA
jgi:uncharacterized protein (DUF924 family)